MAALGRRNDRGRTDLPDLPRRPAQRQQRPQPPARRVRRAREQQARGRRQRCSPRKGHAAHAAPDVRQPRVRGWPRPALGDGPARPHRPDVWPNEGAAAVRVLQRASPLTHERPANADLSGDGRGGFRTCDLSRVKQESRKPKTPRSAGRSRRSRPRVRRPRSPDIADDVPLFRPTGLITAAPELAARCRRCDGGRRRTVSAPGAHRGAAR